MATAVKYDYNAEFMLLVGDALPEVTWEPGNIWSTWRESAACDPDALEARGYDRNLYLAWDLENSAVVNLVRRICTGCSVKAQCLVDALLDPTSQGWRANHYFSGGGLAARSRKILARAYGVPTWPRDKRPVAK